MGYSAYLPTLISALPIEEDAIVAGDDGARGVIGDAGNGTLDQNGDLWISNDITADGNLFVGGDITTGTEIAGVDVDATPSSQLLIRTGTATANTAGALLLEGGGVPSDTGGLVSIEGGQGVTQGGDVSIIGGFGVTGGEVSIEGGTSGGDVRINAGSDGIIRIGTSQLTDINIGGTGSTTVTSLNSDSVLIGGNGEILFGSGQSSKIGPEDSPAGNGNIFTVFGGGTSFSGSDGGDLRLTGGPTVDATAGDVIIGATNTAAVTIGAAGTTVGVVEDLTVGGTIDGVDLAAFAASPVTLIQTITIKTPSNTENTTMFFTPIAITCTKCNSVTIGAASDATFNLYWNPETTRSNVGTAIHSGDMVADTAGTDTTLAAGDVDIPANSWVFIKTSAISNAPTELHVTLTYTED